MPKVYNRSLRPSPFVPTTSFSGEEAPVLIAGENAWLRQGRFPASVKAEMYTGNLDLSETIATKTLTGTIAWTSNVKTITGTGTAFVTELHLGSFVLGDGGSGLTELFVVEKIVSDTSFVCSRAPTASSTGRTAYVLPVLFPIGTDRGTLVRGNAVQFPRGHYLTVGDGTLKINGTALTSSISASKTPRFALYDAATGTYLQDDVGISLPATTPLITLTASATASQMRAGGYGVRVCAYNSKTLGYSNPSDVIAPVALTANQSINIVFNDDMEPDQDGYLIFATPFADNSTTTIEGRYMGPWYLVKTITKSDLIDGGHPLGSETGTTYTFSYADAEIQTATQILSFNNFRPKEAEFVDMINGIPLYFSCLGKGTSAIPGGTSPGPVCIPSKPSNPEAVFLNKAITTAGSDYIIGEFNAKSRIYVLCQNSLQSLVLTTLDDEPITFRSLWNSGFRNPYNVAFVKEYLYGFSTQKIVRSVAGGDDSAMEFEFASDVKDYIDDWEPGHVLVGYDPKNRAVCFFYSAAERRTGYWVTVCLPFLLDRQVWNPPIILKKTNTDFIVSGVATVGNHLEFLAGGRKSDNSISVGTYRFDGGDSETKDWFMLWNFSDDGEELNPKTIKGFTSTGRFADSSTAIKVYGVASDGNFPTNASMIAGTGSSQSVTIGTQTSLGRKKLTLTDWGAYSLYAIRASGSYTTTADRLDEIAFKVEVNNSEA